MFQVSRVSVKSSLSITDHKIIEFVFCVLLSDGGRDVWTVWIFPSGRNVSSGR